MYKVLTITEALKLYSLLKDFVPEDIPNNLFDFAGKILENIMVSDRQENFGEVLLLLTGNTVLELDKLDTADRINKFIGGLQENRFLTLVEFCKSLGL